MRPHRHLSAAIVTVVACTSVGVPTAPARSDAPRVTVPNVHCRRLDVAEDIVRSRGLHVRDVGGGVFGIVVKSNWRVVRERPAAGTSVRRGTRVSLYVARDC
jgi:beta-lactam-binding protein with PASTA domain